MVKLEMYRNDTARCLEKDMLLGQATGLLSSSDKGHAHHEPELPPTSRLNLGM